MEHTLAFYSTTLYRDFFAYSSEQLQTMGLSFGQLPFLLYVGKHIGCTPGELTADLHMDWGYTQRTLARLAADGFLQKEPNVRDRRTCNLLLTERGEQAFRLSHQVFFTWDAKKLSVLSAEERAGLLSGMEKLVRPDETD